MALILAQFPSPEVYSGTHLTNTTFLHSLFLTQEKARAVIFFSEVLLIQHPAITTAFIWPHINTLHCRVSNWIWSGHLFNLGCGMIVRLAGSMFDKAIGSSCRQYGSLFDGVLLQS